jgi:Family of unknown function (DUF6112)
LPGRALATAVVAPLSALGHHVAPAATLLAVTTPIKGFSPTAGSLPGGTTLHTLVNGLAGWALILALAGLLLGAALWAFGSHSQNYQQSFTGKRAVLVSGLAALIIGAAPVIVNFFFNTGVAIPNPAK